jgi:hypothetical protein
MFFLRFSTCPVAVISIIGLVSSCRSHDAPFFPLLCMHVYSIHFVTALRFVGSGFCCFFFVSVNIYTDMYHISFLARPVRRVRRARTSRRFPTRHSPAARLCFSHAPRPPRDPAVIRAAIRAQTVRGAHTERRRRRRRQSHWWSSTAGVCAPRRAVRAAAARIRPSRERERNAAR